MNNKRILFIFPNTANSPAVPNAITILAGIAKRNSWSIKYFDTYKYVKNRDSMQDRETSGEFKPSFHPSSSPLKPYKTIVPDLQHLIDTFRPTIIAISCMSFEYQFLMQFFLNIMIGSETLVILGGIHAILEPETAIDSGLFDLVCIGEGERTFEEILISYYNGENLSKIPNTYFRDKKSGIIYYNEKNKLLNKDQLWNNNPDYSFLSDEYFIYPFDGKLFRRFNLECARGCSYNCSYCGNSALKMAFKGLGKFVRTRPIESIKNCIYKMIQTYNIEMIYFEDECFLQHSLEWISELADWYGKEIKKPFILQTRPETINEKKIRIIKKMNAPFFQISMGVESGSERILRDICNRKMNVNQIVDAFDLLKSHNIRTCAFFMIGFPFETRNNIFESINLCKRIDPDVAIVSIFQPFTGQKLRNICIKEGFLDKNELLQTFTGGSILRMPQISAEEISNLRRVFLLYAMLPEKYYPDIEKCEKSYENNRDLYDQLVNLRWHRT